MERYIILPQGAPKRGDDIRCLGVLGLWGVSRALLVPIAMAPSMQGKGHFVQRITAYCAGNHSMGLQMAGCHLLCRCDNEAVVRILSSRNSRNPDLMHLLRCLFFFEAYYKMHISATHISGITNTLADNLSRNRLSLFLLQAPHMARNPAPLPLMAFDLLLNPACYFATFLAQKGFAPSSMKLYMAAIRHIQIVQGLPEPRTLSSLPRLRLVINGIARSRAQNHQTSAKPRLPITTPILQKIFESLSARPPTHDNFMLWAACSLCFFGFFRAGEITSPSKTGFQPTRHLAWGDVGIDDYANPTLLKVHLKFSKCDQLGKGIDVFIGRTDTKLCPITACLAFIARRGSSPGPFFCHEDGTPLTKMRFCTTVKQSLAQAGMDESLYSGHSFRIGAATSAALAGMEDSTIKALGRWSSAAFLVYVRTPRDQLAKFSKSLAAQGLHVN